MLLYQRMVKSPADIYFRMSNFIWQSWPYVQLPFRTKLHCASERTELRFWKHWGSEDWRHIYLGRRRRSRTTSQKGPWELCGGRWQGLLEFPSLGTAWRNGTKLEKTVKILHGHLWSAQCTIQDLSGILPAWRPSWAKEIIGENGVTPQSLVRKI